MLHASCFEPVFLEKSPLNFCLLSEHLCLAAGWTRGNDCAGTRQWYLVVLGGADMTRSWFYHWTWLDHPKLDVGFLKAFELGRFSEEWGSHLIFLGFVHPARELERLIVLSNFPSHDLVFSCICGID